MAEKKDTEASIPQDAAESGGEKSQTPRVIVRSHKKSTLGSQSGRIKTRKGALTAQEESLRKTPSTVSAKTSTVRPLIHGILQAVDDVPGRQSASAGNNTSRASAYGRFLKTHGNATHRRRPAATSQSFALSGSPENDGTELPSENGPQASTAYEIPAGSAETAASEETPVTPAAPSGETAGTEAPLAAGESDVTPQAVGENPGYTLPGTEPGTEEEPAAEGNETPADELSGGQDGITAPEADEVRGQDENGEPAASYSGERNITAGDDTHAGRIGRLNFPAPGAAGPAAASADTPEAAEETVPAREREEKISEAVRELTESDEFSHRIFRDFHIPASLTAPLEPAAPVQEAASADAAPVTMSTEDMARTLKDSPRDISGGSFRGLVENLQGGPVPGEEPVPAPAPAAHAGSPRILICWVGKVDIGAALRHDQINPGPVRMLLERIERFDHIILLTPQNQNVEDLFREWLASCADENTLEFRRTGVRDLSDHALICSAVMDVVDETIRKFGLPADGTGITFHLSPGSPATHAVLMLLAADRYRGIRLVQTRLPGIGQRPEVLTIEVPSAALTPAAPGDRLPVSASTEPEEQPPVSFDERVHQRYGRGGRYLHKRSIGRGMEQERTDDVIPEPYEGIRKPTTAPNMQAQPQEGEPPTISEALGKVYARVQRIASMPLPVLLMGEDGTGKSRLARFVHEWSGRGGKYVSIECSGLTDAMFTSELFGQKAGDYPGAWRAREGAFRLANGGTIFLENVDMLTPSQQAILLRVLSPSGETVVVLPGQGPRQGFTSRVRIVASASERILEKIHSGEFRPALFYRLAGVSAELPPVRRYTSEERQNLLRSLLVRLQHRLGVCWNFNGDAWQALVEEEWPGNLRELTRMMQQICLMAPADGTITRDYVLSQLRLARICPGEKTAPALTEPAVSAGLPAVPEQDLHGFTAMELPLPGTAGSAPVEDKEPAGQSDDDFEPGGDLSLDDWLRQLRLKKVQEAMEKTGGNRKEAAALLGMSYIQLNYTLRQLRNKEEK